MHVKANKRYSYLSGSSSSSGDEGTGVQCTVGGLGAPLGRHGVEYVDGVTGRRAGSVLLDPLENHENMPESEPEFYLDDEPLVIQDFVLEGRQLLKWSSNLEGDRKAIVLQVAGKEQKAILVSDLNQLVGPLGFERDAVSVYAEGNEIMLEVVIAIVPVDCLKNMEYTITCNEGISVKLGEEDVMKISVELLKKLERQGAINLIKMSRKITAEGCNIVLKMAIGEKVEIKSLNMENNDADMFELEY